MSSTSKRIVFIDCLRGIAALYVVVFHMAFIPGPIMAWPSMLDPFIRFGGTGVQLFFVLSAFSLCMTMPRHIDTNSPLLSYFSSRFFRIAPLFYVMIAFYIFRDDWFFGIRHKMPEVLASATFIFNLIPSRIDGFVWASWTIGVEMIFYVLFPLIYARCKDLSFAIPLLFATIALAILFEPAIVSAGFTGNKLETLKQHSIVRQLPVFIVGMIAFRVYEILIGREDKQKIGHVLLALGALLFIMQATGKLGDILGDRYPTIALVYALLLLGFACVPNAMPVPAILRFYGEISYSVYLIHPSAIYFLIPVYRWIYTLGPNHFVSFAVCAAATVAIITPLAYCTYWAIERPFIRLGRHLTRQRWSFERGPLPGGRSIP